MKAFACIGKGDLAFGHYDGAWKKDWRCICIDIVASSMYTTEALSFPQELFRAYCHRSGQDREGIGRSTVCYHTAQRVSS